MGWTRDLWNISYPSLTTSTPFKSQKILCKTEHWIQIHFNQNEIKQTQHSNSRANVKTRTPKLHNLLQFSPPLPSLTFYGLPPPPSFASFSDIRISSLLPSGRVSLASRCLLGAYLCRLCKPEQGLVQHTRRFCFDTYDTFPSQFSLFFAFT